MHIEHSFVDYFARGMQNMQRWTGDILIYNALGKWRDRFYDRRNNPFRN